MKRSARPLRPAIAGSTVGIVLAALAIAGLPAQAAGDRATLHGMRTSFGLDVPLDAGYRPASLGMGIDLALWSSPGFLPFLSTEGEFSWTAPALFSEPTQQLGRAGIGLSLKIPLGKRLRAVVRGSAGLYLGLDFLDPQPVLGYYYGGSAGVSWALSDFLSLGIETRYNVLSASMPLSSLSLCLDVPLRNTAAPAHAVLPVIKPSGTTPLTGGARPIPPSKNTPIALLAEPSLQELTRRVKQDPGRRLPDLVRALVAGRADDFDRVKALHDWVAMNIAYDVEAYAGRSPMVTEPYAVISRGASVCQGYSEVFQVLCGLAGIECAVLSGYGRGASFDILDDSLPRSSNHAWNAVHIGDRWYLVDCTWDAGAVSYDGYHASYSTEYLFTDPAGFGHTHFPEDPRWQLVERPVAYEEFRDLPYLTGAFFQFGLSMIGRVTRVIAADDWCTLELRVPDGVEVTGFLMAAEYSTGRQMFSSRTGTVVRLEDTFAGPGTLLLNLSASTAGPDADRPIFQFLGTIVVRAARGSTKRYPYLTSIGSASSLHISSPMPYDPVVGGETELSFTVAPDAKLTGFLMKEDDDTGLSDSVWVSNDAGSGTLRVRFPKPGRYTVLLGRMRPDQSGIFDQFAGFSYQATSASATRFPTLFHGVVEEGWSIVAPLDNPLPRGAPVDFEVRPPKSFPLAGEVVVRSAGQTVVLQRGTDGAFRGRVSPVSGDLYVLWRSGAESAYLAMYKVP
jgi:hypothetical protein